MATYSITEWSEHQHYKDRDPSWVKLYQKTLTSITWLKADILARTVMLASILLAARYQNAIPVDEDVLIPALAPRSTKWADMMLALRYLESSGFITIGAIPEKEDISQEEKKPPKSPKGDEHESFPAFWKAYPSRGRAANPRKPAAAAHLAAIKRGADPAELIRLAPTAAPAEKHGTEFVPQATTWLNEDRWKDAPPPEAASNEDPEDVRWKSRLMSLRDRDLWNDALFGPRPSQPGCKAPQRLIDEILGDGLDIPEFMRRKTA